MSMSAALTGMIVVALWQTPTGSRMAPMRVHTMALSLQMADAMDGMLNSHQVGSLGPIC